MAGIAIYSENLVQQPSAVRNKTKPTATRRALGDIKNTNGSISDSTEKSLKPKKLLRTETPLVKKVLIHADKPSGLTPALKPSKRLKSTQTPFKIYVDQQQVNEKVTTCSEIGPLREDHLECFEKEYMPPCTDRDFEIPLPDYVEKVCSSSPSKLLGSLRHINYLDNGRRNIPELDEKEYVMEEEAITTSFTTDVFDESTLLIEPDDSFSMSALEEELRAAQLDLPDWLVDDNPL